MSLSQPSGQNGQSGAEIVTLTDETGRSLDCLVEHVMKQENSTYLLLMPIDSPVTIIAWDDDQESSEAIWVEEEREIKRIFPDAQAVLAEFDLSLKYTAFTLTISGDLPSTDSEEILTLEIEEQDGYLATEEFQYLASFYHNQQEYEIYTPIAPILFLAKRNQAGKLILLSPDELQDIQPLLEEFLFNDIDEL